VISHPLYHSATLDFDFALVELVEDIPMNDCIGFACLPTAEVTSDTECFITGWGTLGVGGATPSVLQEAPVNIIDSETCSKNYENLALDIKDSMLCAQGQTVEGVTDACQGDSGGPFVCMESTGRFVLHGVTSWGHGCAWKDYPGVWSRVSHVRDWIDSVMDSEVTTSTTTTTLPRPGLLFEVFYFSQGGSIPDFANRVPELVHTDKQVNYGSTGDSWPGLTQNDNYAVRCTGQVMITASGEYEFSTTSDDGSRLTIDGTQVVDNDGLHGMQTRSGIQWLSGGMHDLVLEFFEKSGAAGLILEYGGPDTDGRTLVVPASVLSHVEDTNERRRLGSDGRSISSKTVPVTPQPMLEQGILLL